MEWEMRMQQQRAPTAIINNKKEQQIFMFKMKRFYVCIIMQTEIHTISPYWVAQTEFQNLLNFLILIPIHLYVGIWIQQCTVYMYNCLMYGINFRFNFFWHIFLFDVVNNFLWRTHTHIESKVRSLNDKKGFSECTYVSRAMEFCWL